jgi:hypothetical protein
MLAEGARSRASDVETANSVIERAWDVKRNRVGAVSCCVHLNSAVPSYMVKLSLCLTKQALCHEGVWVSGCINPYFLDLGISWRWVVSFTRLPPGKQSPVPIGQEAGWAPEQVWTTWRSENSCPPPGLEHWALGRPARSQSLYWLLYHGSAIIIMNSEVLGFIVTSYLSLSHAVPVHLVYVTTSILYEPIRALSRIAIPISMIFHICIV